MKKRRITLNLDEDVVEFLEAEAHRQALLRWLDELDERYGAPTPEDYAWADEILDEVEGLRDSGTSAA